MIGPAVWRPLTNEEADSAAQAQAHPTPSRSGSLQNSRPQYPKLARFTAGVSVRHRRFHCLVLLRAPARFQQDGCASLSPTAGRPPLGVIHDKSALAAVRRLAYEAADSGLLSPELAAGIRRVKGAKKLGIRLGNWLTACQARALLDAPNVESVRGKRDLPFIRSCHTGAKVACDYQSLSYPLTNGSDAASIHVRFLDLCRR